MRKKRLKNKSSLLVIFFVMTLFIFTFNVTSSRYLGQIESTVNDINAIPILNLTNPIFAETITKMLPGDIFESDFYISNYDGTNTNEVLMKYYIQVSTTNVEIPLEITITDAEGTEIQLDAEGKTPEESLIYGIQNDPRYQIKTKYHIKVKWSENDNSYEYAEKEEKLIIQVVATQVIEEG